MARLPEDYRNMKETRKSVTYSNGMRAHTIIVRSTYDRGRLPDSFPSREKSNPSCKGDAGRPNKQHLCLAAYSTHVKPPVKVNGCQTIAMIDSGATGSFVSRALVQSAGLPTHRKKDPSKLQMIDRSDLSTGVADDETPSLPIVIERRYKELSFDIVGMATGKL